MDIGVVVLDFVDKRTEVNELISECIKSRKYCFELLPVLLSQYTSLVYKMVLHVIIANDVGSVDEEHIQKLD